MSKLEDKTRQLILLREFLEALVKDPWVSMNVQGYAKDALRHWDDPDYLDRK